MITLRQLRYLSFARPPPAFRAGGGRLRGHPAGAVHAGARAGARDRRRTGGAAAGRDRAHRYRPRRRASAPSRFSPPPATWSISRATATCSAGGFGSASFRRWRPTFCRACCRACRRNIRKLRLEVRETQTKMLLEELVAANSMPAMLALPAEGADVETLRAVRRSRSCWRCRPPIRCRRAPRRRGGRRSAPADSAGRGPLPARPGAGVLRRATAAMRRPASARPRSPP